MKLASRRDIERRLMTLLDFYREIYSSIVYLGERVYDPRGLYLTQEYLESDKLALVLRSVVYEAYTAPLVVIIGRDIRPYVIDGHHRTLVWAWLKRPITGYTVLIPEYKPRTVKTLVDIDIVNPHDTPRYLYCWRHLVNIIRFLEKQYGVLAEVWFSNIPLEYLKPTEPPPVPSIVEYKSTTSLDCPVLVYRHSGGYYVVDGHHRVCSRLLSKGRSIEAIVFTIRGGEIGIVKTARRMGYSYFSEEYCISLGE